MIWFTCKQCGKVHSRPENSGGTLVFCSCGEGIRVPWESTAPAQPGESEPIAEMAEPVPSEAWPAPSLEPVKFNPEPVPAPSVPPADRERPPLPPPATGEREEEEGRPRSRRQRFRPDPNFCLNHPTVALHKPCADCRESFCGDCLVAFQGETLCGPCKNLRVRLQDAPPRISGLALSGLIMALAMGPMALCLLPLGRWLGLQYLALGALIPQMLALVLGFLGLRDVEMNPKATGWSIALTAMLTAVVTGFLTVLVSIFGARLGV